MLQAFNNFSCATFFVLRMGFSLMQDASMIERVRRNLLKIYGSFPPGSRRKARIEKVLFFYLHRCKKILFRVRDIFSCINPQSPLPRAENESRFEFIDPAQVISNEIMHLSINLFAFSRVQNAPAFIAVHLNSHLQSESSIKKCCWFLHKKCFMYKCCADVNRVSGFCFHF